MARRGHKTFWCKLSNNTKPMEATLEKFERIINSLLKNIPINNFWKQVKLSVNDTTLFCAVSWHNKINEKSDHNDFHQIKIFASLIDGPKSDKIQNIKNGDKKIQTQLGNDELMPHWPDTVSTNTWLITSTLYMTN